MDDPTVSARGERYLLRVRGELGPLLEGWFEGMTVEPTGSGELIISGAVADQSALHGLFARLHALRLPIIEVRLLPSSGDAPGSIA